MNRQRAQIYVNPSRRNVTKESIYNLFLHHDVIFTSRCDRELFFYVMFNIAM